MTRRRHSALWRECAAHSWPYTMISPDLGSVGVAIFESERLARLRVIAHAEKTDRAWREKHDTSPTVEDKSHST